MLRYIVPFHRVSLWIDQRADPHTGTIDMPYFDYLGLIRRLIEPVFVDETHYLQTYPVIANRIERGMIRSAFHHYVAHGYFEGRTPFAPDRQDLRTPVPFPDLSTQTKVRPDRQGLRALTSKPELMSIVQRLVASVPVDEFFYRTTYPGVAQAIDRGDFPSAAAHFTEYGYSEARFPFPMPVDEAFYLARYPDVRALIDEGKADSAQAHFWAHGYREGRFPAASPLLC